ncbi:hypothetical protein [Azospirillum sp. Sh1]|uniref:hypothetical protein n=1 Tax=Azospirillum sp. Sh1 TaxID=2607285 RepID=UPI00165DBA9A|nr:hypothetical protein [Azospirillum sp. Sh1]
MSTIKIRVTYLECRTGHSNKWYVGVDLSEAIADGEERALVGHGPIGSIQSLTATTVRDMSAKLRQKQSARKGYDRATFEFGSAWGRTLAEALIRKTKELLGSTLGPAVASVTTEMDGAGGLWLKLDLGEIAETPAPSAPADVVLDDAPWAEGW